MKESPVELPRTVETVGEQVLCRSEFDALYERYKELVFKYSYYLTRDRGEAEELFQETWLRVVRNFADIDRGPERLKPWLCTIVSNLYKDSLRRKKTRRQFVGGEGFPKAVPGSADMAPEAIDPSPGPEQSAENAALGGRLQRALEGLPEQQRRVFLLKEVEGLKLDEIAEVLSIPLGTVKSLGFRAVRALRRTLEECEGAKGKNPCDVGIMKAV